MNPIERQDSSEIIGQLEQTINKAIDSFGFDLSDELKKAPPIARAHEVIYLLTQRINVYSNASEKEILKKAIANASELIQEIESILDKLSRVPIRTTAFSIEANRGS